MRSHAHADADNGEHDEPKPAENTASGPAPKAELSVEDRLTALEATVARIAPLIGE